MFTEVGDASELMQRAFRVFDVDGVSYICVRYVAYMSWVAVRSTGWGTDGGSIDAEEFSSMIPLLGEVSVQHYPCMLLYSLLSITAAGAAEFDREASGSTVY